MTKLTWIGDDDPEAQSVTMGGVTFVKGVATEVKDGKLAAKLATNHMFSSDAKAKATPAAQPTADELAARAEEGTEIGALKAQLRALSVEPKEGASVDDLRAALVKAAA